MIVYYLTVPEEQQKLLESVAEKSNLRKVKFQVVDNKTHTKENFSGWSGHDLAEKTFFKNTASGCVQPKDINYFLSYDGGKIYPCLINFKIKDHRDRKKFEEYNSRMETKPP